jgi:hypothetical protein
LPSPALQYAHQQYPAPACRISAVRVPTHGDGFKQKFLRLIRLHEALLPRKLQEICGENGLSLSEK